MNTQIPIVRHLLPLALACSLLAPLTPAAQAGADPAGAPLQSSSESKASGAQTGSEEGGCGQLHLIISGSAAKVTQVNCKHGFLRRNIPPDGAIEPGKPVNVILIQSLTHGPDCTVTIDGGGNRVVLAAQQNFCFAEGADIKASVVSGRATFKGKAEGAFPDIPGMVWFSLDF